MEIGGRDDFFFQILFGKARFRRNFDKPFFSQVKKIAARQRLFGIKVGGIKKAGGDDDLILRI